MSLLQGIKVSTQHDRAGLYKLNLLDTRNHFLPCIHQMARQGHGLFERSNPLTMSMCLLMSSCPVGIDDLVFRLIAFRSYSSIKKCSLLHQVKLTNLKKKKRKRDKRRKGGYKTRGRSRHKPSLLNCYLSFGPLLGG